MGFIDVFPNSTHFPVPLYPIIGIFLSLALYYALFKFNLQSIIQKLLGLTNECSHITKTIIYLFFINFPLILLFAISIINESNQIGFQISCDVDHMQIILISSYICYVEESRQTPIRGFIFNRDLFTLVCFLAILLLFNQNGQFKNEYGFILGSLYLVYLVLQISEEKLENFSLKILGMKESMDYNSNFLLTQSRKQANFLKIKNTIEENKKTIQIECQQFKQMLQKLYVNDAEKNVLNNFAKLFLPYKIAIEIEEQNLIQENINKICENWVESSNTNQNDDQLDTVNEGEDQGQGRGKQSATCLTFNRTMTDDYSIEEQELRVYDDTTFNKVIKYCFYPLYLISTVEGRPRYFLDYLCVFLLMGSMFLISASCAYFTEQTSYYSYSIISLLLAVAISIPSGQYYLRISAINDFDFINIFLQSAILKAVIFGILLTIISFTNPQNAKGNNGLMISNIINLVTYCLYGAFMIAQKFATLKSNLKYLIGLSAVSFLCRIVAELVYNLIMGV